MEAESRTADDASAQRVVAAARLTGALSHHLLGPPLNVFRACLHPDGPARSTLNFAEWATYLVGQPQRAALLTDDPELERLADEVGKYPNVEELSLFTTLTTFERSDAWLRAANAQTVR